MSDDSKRALVERAVAAAVSVRPILESRATALPTVVAPTDAALAAARQWLLDGDPASPARACADAVPVIERAWLSWDELASVTKDLVALKRALHAAEAAVLAARAAAWTPAEAERAASGDGQARARATNGPFWEAAEAERCAALAQGLT